MKENVTGTVNSEVKVRQSKEFLKYEFTHDEIHQKGIELARLSSEHIAIDNERKAIASSFKAKIDGKVAEIEMIDNQINNGYEHRYIDCEVHYNNPNTGIKSTFRKDNGALVKKESMTPEELQIEIQYSDNNN
jgi:hypothetical protein